MKIHFFSPRRNRIIIWICISVAFIVLILLLLLQTDYMQYQLRQFGLTDVRHNDNRSTISSWNSCLQQLNCDADVVFFGDSLTAGYDFQSVFPNVSIVNLGLSGDSILDMIDRTYMLETVKPEKVFLMAGINSLNSENLIEKYVSQYANLCDKIIDAVPHADLYILSVLPVSSDNDNRFLNHMRGTNNTFITRFNDMIRQYAEQHDLVYINLYQYYESNGSLNPEYSVDGLHITQDSYELWINAIRPYVI